MATITITQERQGNKIIIRALPDGRHLADLCDGEENLTICRGGRLAALYADFGIDGSDIICPDDRNEALLAEAGYTAEFARWVDAQQGWQNKVVDDAGYLIDTATKLMCEIARLDRVANESDFAFKSDGIFGVHNDSASNREYKAKELREIARCLMACADELSGPQIDESDSSKIGYDASHSDLT